MFNNTSMVNLLLNKSMFMKSSKHRGPGDQTTGPEAAGKFRARHSGGRPTIARLEREARIHNGARPLSFGQAGGRERTIAKRVAAR
jgi:hypothetical protein